MARPVREPNLRLQMLIEEAGFAHKGLARRVNDLGRAKGIPGLSYDHSSVIRWLKGENPRGTAPTLIAEVLSMSLGRKITVAELGFQTAGELPDLGLRFSPSWHDTIEAITALWRNDLERRQFIIEFGFFRWSVCNLSNPMAYHPADLDEPASIPDEAGRRC